MAFDYILVCATSRGDWTLPLNKVRQINANSIFGKLTNKVAALALGQRAQVALAAYATREGLNRSSPLDKWGGGAEGEIRLSAIPE